MVLLDTNILSELIKKKPNPFLLDRLSMRSPESLFTSVICVMELRMGSALRVDFTSFWGKICEEILSRVSIIPIGEAEAEAAGDILASLKRTGRWIGIEDVLVAATAITHRLVTVTANVGHFSRVEGLSIENWLLPGE